LCVVVEINQNPFILEHIFVPNVAKHGGRYGQVCHDREVGFYEKVAALITQTGSVSSVDESISDVVL
jgi:hypothetical protein